MTDSGIARLVLVGCSGLLGEILIGTLARQPGITVVASLEATTSLAETIRDQRPDIVLWNHADEHALADSVDCYLPVPPPKVLATVCDGRETALWELRPHRTPLGQLSPEDLVGVIRAAVAS